MKVIHVTDTSIYNYDGISSYINELLESGENKKDEILVLTTVPLCREKVRAFNHSCKVHVFPNISFLSSSKLMFGFPLGIKKIIGDFKPDLIWIHTIGAIGIAAAQISKGKYSIVYSKHCFDGDLWCNHLKIRPSLQWFFQWAAKIIEGWIAKPANKIICHFSNQYKLKENIYSKKIHYYPPPLNARFFEKVKHKNPSQGKLTLGFCGRCDPEKGLETLFKGFKIFQTKYPHIFLDILLIGDGEVATEMKIKYPSISVKVTGFVNDVIPYLDKLDAFVFASKTETTSLASMEAYARNLKIFTTPVGFLGENSSKYSNIFLYDNPEGLANLIHNILINKSKEEVKENCLFSSSIISYKQLYDIVIGSL